MAILTKRRKYFTQKLVPMASNSKIYIIISMIQSTMISLKIWTIQLRIINYELNAYCSFIDMNLMMNAIFGINLSLNNDKTGYVAKVLPVPQAWFLSITRVLILAACFKNLMLVHLYLNSLQVIIMD